MSLEFEPEQRPFLGSLLATGRYAWAEEAAGDAVRLLQSREGWLQKLREAWREGVDSGDCDRLDALLDGLTANRATRADI